MDKDFYNSSSAAKLGWTPSWFGCQEFDFELVKAVQKWQKKNRLTADGLVGPATYRRIWTEREANISDWAEAFSSVKSYRSGDKSIVHNGNFIPIDWDKVVLWDEPSGFKSDQGCYTDYSGREDRKPTMFVNHWDVCLSSESCAKVLNKRGISVHFLIDNDGTIYQMLDTQHKAWHAGIPKYEGGNTKGIGVEISNAYYLKYQDWYVKNGFGERPIKDDAVVHGKVKEPFLDFYPVQMEALKALWKAVHIGIGIPLEYPKTDSGIFDTGLNVDCERGRFNGFCNHYNFIKTKIDCAGMDLPSMLEDVKNHTMYCLDRG
tara:strand:- start:2517 stop:3470 length:954 start_codon:yes stop_codon:yes gene_type:complete